VVSEYARADRRQTELAIRAASEALPHWSHSTPQRRADVLDQIGSEILARKDELGMLLAREEGKTLPEGVGEAARAGQIFKFFAGEALRVQGETMASVRPGIQVDVTREPVGVVGIIAPWNFPLAIPAWKIAPALAYGNTVVFKPAELVPACGWALAEIISRAACRRACSTWSWAAAGKSGQTLVDQPLVHALSFTGSVSTGERILQSAAARRAKVQLEMGGKNPLVVLADADLDRAVDCAVQGAYFSTGQRCTASSRLIVEAPVHDAFVARLRHRIAALKVGHALERGIEMGPVVDSRASWTRTSRIWRSRATRAPSMSGAANCWNARHRALHEPGAFPGPARAPHRARGNFRPVACVLQADDYDHALALANDTPFGLCAGICTSSLKHAMHFKRHAEVGMVMVNLPTAGVDLPRALRRPQGLELRPARAGPPRRRVLHHRQDRLRAGLSRTKITKSHARSRQELSVRFQPRRRQHENESPHPRRRARRPALAGLLPASAWAQKPIVLGFSQVGAESEWRTANTESIKSAAKEAGIELKFADAQQKQENQIKAIRSFIAQRST
jgi:acyl-CoA reductase-like NAD-dependent aldehyde dehydrogenase